MDVCYYASIPIDSLFGIIGLRGAKILLTVQLN
jgi:hypothetical protein